MNDKYPQGTGSTALCFIKGETEIQEKVKEKKKNKPKPCPRSQNQSVAVLRQRLNPGFFQLSCTNSNSHVLEVHVPVFFSNHTKKINWGRLFTLK